MKKIKSVYEEHKDILERIEINGKKYTFLNSNAYKDKTMNITFKQYFDPGYIDRILNNYNKKKK